MEAAQELARQIKLKDLSGLIVVDFIDMMESRNRFAIEKMLRDAMQNDRARVQVGRISPFGLLEMSRQRLRPSYAETHTTKCNHCAGIGSVRSSESLAVAMFRAIEHDISYGEYDQVNVYAGIDVVLYVLNHKRFDLNNIELRYSTHIIIQSRSDLVGDNFVIDKVRRSAKGAKPVKQVSLTSLDSVGMEDLESFSDHDEPREQRKPSKGDGGSKKNWRWFKAEEEAAASNAASNVAASSPSVAVAEVKSSGEEGEVVEGYNNKRRVRKYPNKKYNVFIDYLIY
jgi:ribonuclease E